MTNDQTVTQALEPCPFCGGEAEWRDDPGVCGLPFGLVVDHAPSCFLGIPMSEEAMVAAWNTRTAHSGEGRSNEAKRSVIERAVADDLIAAIYKAEGWMPGDKAGFETRTARCSALYEITADPRRNRYVATPLSIPRSNGAGEDRLSSALAEHFPTGIRGLYEQSAQRIPVQTHVGTNCLCGWCTSATDEQEVREEWAAHVAAALSAPQGEVERGTLPRLDEGLIIAAMRGHYGSKADSIDGLDLTADDVNWSFRDGFTRMWAGVRKELKRRAALAQPEAGGEHE